jgi:hypothetical protein
MSTATTKHEEKGEPQGPKESAEAAAISADEAERLASQFTASWEMVPDSPADLPAADAPAQVAVQAPVDAVVPAEPSEISASDVLEEAPMQLQTRKRRRPRPDSDRPPPGPEVDQFVSIVASPPKRAEVAVNTGPSVVLPQEHQDRLNKTVKLDAVADPFASKRHPDGSLDELEPPKKKPPVVVFAVLGLVAVIGLAAGARALLGSSDSSSAAPSVTATQPSQPAVAATPAQTAEPKPVAVDAKTADPVKPAVTAEPQQAAAPEKASAPERKAASDKAPSTKPAANPPASKSSKSSTDASAKKSGGSKGSGGIVRETPF